VSRYLESLLDYLVNYALRVRPLLDLSEVGVMIMMLGLVYALIDILLNYVPTILLADVS